MFISIELESEDESDLPDFSAFKIMRDASRLVREKLKSLETKKYELEDAIHAPRSKMREAQLRIAKLRQEIQKATDDLLDNGYVFPPSGLRMQRKFQYYYLFPVRISYIFFFNDKERKKKARTDAAAQHYGKTITRYFSNVPVVCMLPLDSDLVDVDDVYSEADGHTSDESDTVDAAFSKRFVSEFVEELPSHIRQTDINWRSPTNSDTKCFAKAALQLESQYFCASKPSEIGCKYDVRRAMATSLFFTKLSDGCKVGIAAKKVAAIFYSKDHTLWRERSIIRWAKCFVREGRLPPQIQGKHIKVMSLMVEPQIAKQATFFFKSLKDGERTAEKFRSWINDTLIPSLGDGRKFKNGTAKPNVCIKTAQAWLHLLGWIYGSHKKDVYVDGESDNSKLAIIFLLL